MKKIGHKFSWIVFVLLSWSLMGQTQKNPAFEEVLSLKSVSGVQLSPNGKHVVFSVRSTDWKANRYDTELWLSKNGDEPFPLTQTPDGSSYGALWSPNNQWIAFLTKRGEHTQIFAIRAEGGEAISITKEETDVQSFEWAADGQSLFFTRKPKKPKSAEIRKDRFGAYEVDDEEYQPSWLYQIPFNPDQLPESTFPCYDKKGELDIQSWPCSEWPKGTALVDSVGFHIRSFLPSPDGRYVALTTSPNPLINGFLDADIQLLDLETGTLEVIIENKSSDFIEAWSPDGKYLLFGSDQDDRSANFYKNDHYFIFDIGQETTQEVATDFDENLRQIYWTPQGIFATASQQTHVHLFKVDPASGSVNQVTDTPSQYGGISFSKDGTQMAFSASDETSLSEVFVSPSGSIVPKRITNFNEQIKDWMVADAEVIQWESQDGAEIEGVLLKPQNFDATKKYPLFVVIHGGPTGTSRPAPIFSYVYPINQWLNKGALVLMPNYRGSAGYGEAFRSLNVRNLGVGDAWDVLSGVDYLLEQGMVDATKMAAMGWSQGGYISAFLTTTSDRFQAISVGAGISNWMTYYVNTDIHPFTRQYLKATPWEDEAIYKKTSPMTYINDAKTPTLIQHGEFDKRVPIPNAYELLQGLRDQEVPAKLIVYKGFGHGISKPKERVAAVWHNWQWFNKYIWGEEIELPLQSGND